MRFSMPGFNDPSEVGRSIVDELRAYGLVDQNAGIEPGTSEHAELQTLLMEYRANNPRFLGSVARGTARAGRDIDIFPVQRLEQPVSDPALAYTVSP